MSESQKQQESDDGNLKEEYEETHGEVDNGDATNDPRCWSNASRLKATACIGVLAFLEPFASSMVAPSLEIIAEEFSITSSVKRNVSDTSITTLQREC
jgi:hypothetical protein